MKYGEIDVLFNGMPMTLDEPITVNGARLKKVNSNMRHTSMPVYCGYARVTGMFQCAVEYGR